MLWVLVILSLDCIESVSLLLVLILMDWLIVILHRLRAFAPHSILLLKQIVLNWDDGLGSQALKLLDWANRTSASTPLISFEMVIHVFEVELCKHLMRLWAFNCSIHTSVLLTKIALWPLQRHVIFLTTNHLLSSIPWARSLIELRCLSIPRCCVPQIELFLKLIYECSFALTHWTSPRWRLTAISIVSSIRRF